MVMGQEIDGLPEGEGQGTIVDEVEEYIRRLAAGLPVDVGVREDPHSEAAQARALELTLIHYQQFVRRYEDARPKDFYVDRPTRWGNPHRRAEPTADERRRVVLLFARDFATKSLAQLHEEVETIRRVIQNGGRLSCRSCPPDVCHGQVWEFWALTGRDPLKPAPDSGRGSWKPRP